MANIQEIVEKLSQFNNLSFTKKQWDIILKGCGCPKSAHFWKALRVNVLNKIGNIYTLIDMNTESFNNVWKHYSHNNNMYVKKSANKAKAKQKASERINRVQGTVYFVVNGVVTTERPERD